MDVCWADKKAALMDVSLVVAKVVQMVAQSAVCSADQKALTTVVLRVGKWDGSTAVDSAAR